MMYETNMQYQIYFFLLPRTVNPTMKDLSETNCRNTEKPADRCRLMIPGLISELLQIVTEESVNFIKRNLIHLIVKVSVRRSLDHNQFLRLCCIPVNVIGKIL